MKKLLIKSDDPNDTTYDIEEKLLNAVKSIQLKRESQPITDPYLRAQKEATDQIVRKVFENMVEEILEVLHGGADGEEMEKAAVPGEAPLFKNGEKVYFDLEKQKTRRRWNSTA